MGEFTIEEIRKRHPKWLDENIQHILAHEGYWERLKTEVLLETVCQKCKCQMGEHTWNKILADFECTVEVRELVQKMQKMREAKQA